MNLPVQEMSSCLIIASNFPPIQSAGVYRTLRMVKYLPVLGWSLNVLTLSTDTLQQKTAIDLALLDQVPNDIQIYRASARFPIDTFNRAIGRDRKKTISRNITVCPTVQSIKHTERAPSFFQQFKDRITVAFTTPDRLVGWVGKAVKLGRQIVRGGSIDVIYSSGPEWSNHLVASRIAKGAGIPWVADFRDPWVGNTFRPGRSGDSWAGRRHRLLEQRVFQQANIVVFNTDRARADAVSRIGGDLAQKSLVIPNGFDPEYFSNVGLPQHCGSRNLEPLKMVHAGAFYGKRNIDVLLVTIGRLKRSQRLTKNDFQLNLIGPVRPHEQRLVEENAISDLVKLTPRMPHQDCLNQLRQADALLLVQINAPLCVPGKLYEYIALKKPVFTIAADGATADLVISENIGFCVDPADSSKLETGLMELLQQHRRNKLSGTVDAIRDRYDGQQQMVLFDAALRKAIGQ